MEDRSALGQKYCVYCAVTNSKEELVKAAKMGRVAAKTPEARARRAKSQHRHQVAQRGWLASSLPAWLDNEAYLRKIQPLLRKLTCSAIADALGVSMPYAADIRAGRHIPHPRHWLTLTQLVGGALGPNEGSKFRLERRQ